MRPATAPPGSPSGPIGNAPPGSPARPIGTAPPGALGGPIGGAPAGAPPPKKEPSASPGPYGQSPFAPAAMPATNAGTTNRASTAPPMPATATVLGGRAAPPPGDATNAYVECGKSLTQQPYIASVDGRGAGAVLSPGRASTIAGCGFGNKRGTATISGSAGGISNLQLIVDSWNDTQIRVRIDPKLGGVPDQANVVLTVTRADNRTLQANGHAFEAARDEILLPSMPGGLVTRQDLRDYPAPSQLVSPSPYGGTLFVATKDRCQHWNCGTIFANGDVVGASRIALKNGFALSRVEAFDQTKAFLGNELPQYAKPLQTFSLSRQAADYVVIPGWREATGSPAEGAISELPAGIASAYEIRVYVRGPRGLAPL